MWLGYITNSVCRKRLKEALSEAHDVNQQAIAELQEREQINKILSQTIKRQRREWAQVFYEEMKRAEHMMRR